MRSFIVVLFLPVFLPAPCITVQAASGMPLPFLIKGVIFTINDDKVRYREQPGLDGRILGLHAKGTEVVPIQVSDNTDTVGETSYWYKCVVEPDRKVSGWVFGRYLSARLELKDERVTIVGFKGGYNEENWIRHDGVPVKFDVKMMFTNSFVNGVLVNLTGEQLRETIPPDQQYSVRSPDGAKLFATITIPHMAHTAFPYATADIVSEPETSDGVMRWVKSEATLSKDITLGSATVYDTVTGSTVAASFQDYIRSEFRKHSGTLPSTGAIRVDSLEIRRCPILDNGRPSRSECYYAHFVGLCRGWSLAVECFLVRHPDGTVVRSNLVVDAEEKDHTTSDGPFNDGSMPWFYVAFGGTDFYGFPTTLIEVSQQMYEGSQYYFYVTNGYVVFRLGMSYGEGPEGVTEVQVD